MKPYTADDFAHSPFIVFYEVTRACDLVCKHCRACAQPRRHPNELTHGQSVALIDQLAQFSRPPLLVLTGGDPLKRDDIFELIDYARSRQIDVAMTPSATPLVTRDALRRMHDAGLHRLALSLDAADAHTHDAFRGVTGSYQRTLEILYDARDVGLTLQINTTITKRNFDQIDVMADLIAGYGILLWSVFFLVPVGRGLMEQRITPQQYEHAFERLWHHTRRQPYAIKTTEAHHYRRFVLQHAGNPQLGPARAPLGINDGRGVMFISHTGQVFPSGFMPIDCGRFPEKSVIDIYQSAPLFQQLRNPDLFHGKCGVCEYRQVCGGSRARAYTVTRDPLASEPDCAYLPESLRTLQPQEANKCSA